MPEEFATSTLRKTTQTKIEYYIKRVLGADPEPQKREGGGLPSASGEHIAPAYPGTGPSALQAKGVTELSKRGWLAGSAAELWDVSLLQRHCAPNDSGALLSASESKRC